MTEPNKLPAQLAGNLDVPPSVWADARRLEAHLPECLVAVYTRPEELVLDTAGAALIPAITTGRRCAVFVPEERDAEIAALLDTATAKQQDLAQVRLVGVDDVADAVSAYTDEAHLVIATCEATRVPGWWSAARGALRTGGHAAIVCATVDIGFHPRIVTGATGAGMAFTQHVIAVSSTILDDAVAVEATVDDGRRRRYKTHTRSHRDVYVFRNPSTLANLGAPRQVV